MTQASNSPKEKLPALDTAKQLSDSITSVETETASPAETEFDPQVAISVERLSKSYGGVMAVQDLNFKVKTGKITGFLGPNGSGKSTTLRIALSLVEATAGRVLIKGKSYRELELPAKVVGAALDPNSFNPGLTGENHLAIFALASGLERSRIPEVLAQCGLDQQAAGRKISGYSLGMRQRLALATALLGDPEILILDEPINGLDPAGIIWLRSLFKELTGKGKTVFLSSHLLSEIEQTVDELIIINHGKLIFTGALDQLQLNQATIINSPDSKKLEQLLKDNSLEFEKISTGFKVRHSSAIELGELARKNDLALALLQPDSHGLEANFLSLLQETPNAN